MKAGIFVRSFREIITKGAPIEASAYLGLIQTIASEGTTKEVPRIGLDLFAGLPETDKSLGWETQAQKAYIPRGDSKSAAPSHGSGVEFCFCIRIFLTRNGGPTRLPSGLACLAI